MAEVTQADREFAAGYAWTEGDVGTQQLRHDIRTGKRDDHHMVKAAARHRTEAVKPLLEALLGLLAFAEDAETKLIVGDEGCLWPVEAARQALEGYGYADQQ